MRTSICERRPPVSECPLSLKETETMARYAYSLIAEEYYKAAHVTCRNFDETVDVFLKEHPPNLQCGERYLEIGCGRSRLSRYSRNGVQVLLLDISEDMLLHSKRQGKDRASLLVGSAFGLPLRDGTLTGAFAFLADPFLHPVYFQELRRTLKTGGQILQIVPSHEWGSTLRAHRHSPAHFSHFFRGAREAFGPSFLLPNSALQGLAHLAGFADIRLSTLRLPTKVSNNDISPDITLPAEVLGVSPYELSLLTVIQATAR